MSRKPAFLLCLDTSGRRCAVLLRRPRERDVFAIQDITDGHDRVLAPMVQDILDHAKIAATTIDQVAVCVGPGGFGGIRVGVAFARSFGLAAKADVVGVNALDLWVQDAQRRGGPLAAGVHDGGRGEAVALVRDGDNVIGQPVLEPMDRVEKALRAAAASRGRTLYVAGTGAHAVSGGSIAMVGAGAVDLALMADLAVGLTPDMAPAIPAYHRPPDAKPAAAPGNE